MMIDPLLLTLANIAVIGGSFYLYHWGASARKREKLLIAGMRNIIDAADGSFSVTTAIVSLRAVGEEP